MNPNSTPQSPSDGASTGFVSSILAWAKQPFNSQGSVLNWILFVGLLIVAAGLWQFVLIKINKEV